MTYAKKYTTGEGLVLCADETYRWGTLGAAGLFLLSAEGTVLMQHRALWTNRGGTWALPGGAIEVGETPEAAALRETHEETGVLPDNVEVACSIVTAREPVLHALRRRHVTEEELANYAPQYLRYSHAFTGEQPFGSELQHHEEHQKIREMLKTNPIYHADGSELTCGLGGIYYWQFPDSTMNMWTYTTVIAQCQGELLTDPTAESYELAWCPLAHLEELNLMPEFRTSLPAIRSELARMKG